MKVKIKKSYNVLIVGAGAIGSGYDFPGSTNYLTHAHAFKDHDGFNLIGFVDIDEAKAEAASLKWGTEYFPSIKSAFENEEIDVVCLAAPDGAHYSLLKEIVLFKPKFVVAEKPLTKDLYEAIEVVSLYKNIGTCVNFKRRFIPEYESLRKKINSGKFGEFLSGNGLYGKGFIHNGSHLINMLTYLLDITWSDFRKINSNCDYTKDDPSFSILMLSSNNKANFMLNYVAQSMYTIFDIDLVFQRGRIKITDLGAKIEEYQVSKHPLHKNMDVLLLEKSYQTGIDKSLMYLAEDVFYNLSEGKALKCTFEEVLMDMFLMNKILKNF